MRRKLHIELLDIEPKIWRLVAVPDNIMLDELHAVIQGAFGWQDTHLHSFLIGEKTYTVLNPEWPADDDLDEREVALFDLVRQGDTFRYWYDFGDDWFHAITVLDEYSPEHVADWNRPVCLAGEQACPPEDCGGPVGYDQLRTVLTDSSHPEHSFLKEWADGHDPALFSVQQANALVMAIYVWCMERKGKPINTEVL